MQKRVLGVSQQECCRCILYHGCTNHIDIPSVLQLHFQLQAFRLDLPLSLMLQDVIVGLLVQLLVKTGNILLCPVRVGLLLPLLHKREVALHVAIRAGATHAV